ncbi:biliverdin-producing heme oxygenase [Blastococcus sp. CT_GayMR16]|uniref:biliverdin-producing heme oxygenase n=1 Tax=Blastococcus sp. CT_GayMR16 TaxID=2559607 RepID=UPI0010735AFA|nr:biliverdin-producing heme oxygenase [Blastococcus sp. CT_GayMR16]TFV85944.1 heme oxygenase [Blastococcus sp. CT_GayMR16]
MAPGEATAAAANSDVLHLLRTGTAAEHESVERTLDLLDPDLDRARLTGVLTRMHGFWQAAEAVLDDWAARFPADAETVRWFARRRAALFAADLDTLGAGPADAGPVLPPVADTDDALGRLYVLEGSTLGGTFIDRHLTGLPALSGVRLRSFSPYGADTGAMWHAFRRVTRDHVAGGGDAGAMVSAATGTFRALEQWCRPAGVAA